ncbi:MAG: hypothetical protein NXH75_17175, partial [Halobacteriovoraceae bacterium]|nr:hypothetical protein [Halobacteriovoraceae bacterium]
DGTGIVNSRETDPNASRQTPACNVIRAGTEASDHHPGTGYTKENLMNCIKAIQDYILTDIPQPIPTSNDNRLAELRNTVLGRLFELPNEEQEFAAAIFTLDGEVGHHSRDNPMEGLMVLKTLQNRRDNANGIQDALQACRDNHSDPAERSTCMGEANSDSTFNLLDISLDRMQFSMYNSPELDGNWHVKFGTKEDPQFTDAIDTFFNYKGVEEWTINGNSDASIHEIYHYHTTASHPDWRRDSMQLSISGTHSELGDLDSTGVHVFYENHDARIAGSNRADGWWRNVRHEFRSFPSGD